VSGLCLALIISVGLTLSAAMPRRRVSFPGNVSEAWYYRTKKQKIFSA
jgi:hypothetical protein